MFKVKNKNSGFIRDVFRTLSDIYDESFFADIVNYFGRFPEKEMLQNFSNKSQEHPLDKVLLSCSLEICIFIRIALCWMFSRELAINFHSEFSEEHPQGVAFNTNKKDKDSVIYVVMSSVMIIANLQQIWPIIQMMV